MHSTTRSAGGQSGFWLALAGILILQGSVVDLASANESSTPAANIAMNADTNRTAGTGGGDVSVAFAGFMAVSDGTAVNPPIIYTPGVGQNIALSVAPGFQFASNITVSSPDFGFEGQPANTPVAIPTTGAANEVVLINLSSGGTNASETIFFTGISVRIISSAGASVGLHDVVRVTTTGISGSLTDVVVGRANVSAGAAHHLAFSANPASSAAGADLMPVVAIQDFGNNTVVGSDRLISLDIQANPGAAVLQGNRQHNSVAGLATWVGADNLRINVAANGYTLRATNLGAALAGANTADSAAFNISAGAADHLAFSVQPNSAASGADIITSVTAFDAFNNLVSGAPITLGLGSNPTGATLMVGSNLTKNTNGSGVASWLAADDLRINTAGTGYRLLATGATTPALSNTFNVSAGALQNFMVAAAPTNTVAGTSTTVLITARDAANNPIPNFDPTTDIDITTNTAGATNLSFADGAIGSVVAAEIGNTNVARISAAGANTFDANGQANFTITNNLAEGPITITVTNNGGGPTGNTAGSGTNVTWTTAPASAANSSVIANDGSAVADGVDAEAITVTIRDTLNAPLSGHGVSLSILSASVNPAAVTITPAAPNTNGGGMAAFSVRSSVAQSVTFRATDTTDSVVVTQTAAVNFTANATSAANSTVVAADGVAMADNIDLEFITVTLNNSLGNPVAGHNVSLTTVSGGVVITAPGGTMSNSNGEVLFAVRSNTAQTATFTGRDTTDGVDVTMTADVIFSNATNLTAISLSYDSIISEAVLTYAVSGPLAVGPYNIEVFLDDGDNVFNAALDGPALTTIMPPAVESTLGLHQLVIDFTVLPLTPLAANDRIFAVIDRLPLPNGAVIETEETTDNIATTVNTAITNFSIDSIAVTYVNPATTNVDVGYSIDSTTAAPAGTQIEIWLDRDGDTTLDVLLTTFASADLNLTANGLNRFTGARNIRATGGNVTNGLDNATVQNGDRVVALLVTPAVQDTTDDDKFTTLNVDLAAAGLSYDTNSNIATFNYVVNAPANVPAYLIQFYLDTNGTAGLQVGTDMAIGVAHIFPEVSVEPGAHSVSQSYVGNVPAPGQEIYAVVDSNIPDDVLESNEGNNQGTTSSTAGSNLSIDAVSLDVVSPTQTNVRVTYSIDTPVPALPGNRIEVWLDRASNGAGDDELITTFLSGDLDFSANGINRVVTRSIRTTGGAVAFGLDDINLGNGDTMVARFVITGGQLNSTIADDFKYTAPVKIDLRIIALSLRGAPDFAVTNVSYFVESPAAVAPYNLRIGVDTLAATDVNVAAGVIAAGGVLYDFQVEAHQPSVLPGVHNTNDPMDPGFVDDILLADRMIAANKIIVPGKPVRIVSEIDAGAVGAVFEAGEDLIAANTIAERKLNSSSANEKYVLDLSISTFTFDGFKLGDKFPISYTYNIALNPLPSNVSTQVRVKAIPNFANPATPVQVLNGRSIGAAPIERTIGKHEIDLAAVAVAVAPDANAPTSGDYRIEVVIDELGIGSNDSGNVIEGNAAGGDDETVDNSQFQNNAGKNNSDVDGDGLTLAQENLDEGVGMNPVETEIVLQAADGTTNLPRPATSDRNADADGDHLTDMEEIEHHTNPLMADTDGDGLTDSQEINGTVDGTVGGATTWTVTTACGTKSVPLFKTNPLNWDTDGDGLSDFEESAYGGWKVSQYAEDSRSGRFGSAGQTSCLVFSNPTIADTDGDGISDWNEVNTWAHAAGVDGSVVGIGLDPIKARISLAVVKPAPGIRTDPTTDDSDGDTISDMLDPAPQINPLRFGFDQNGDDVFDDADISLIRESLIRDGLIASDADFDNAAFQTFLLNFDQDKDGFLEAPDVNADGFPDFTRYNEGTLELAYSVDFSNNGDLQDGFDIGGLGKGEVDQSGENRFGSYRVGDGAGVQGGDGALDSDDSNNQLIASDNCPRQKNPEQLDFDGDGLGDDCDADLDNDGVPNIFDPIRQLPITAQGFPGICGIGAFQSMFGAMLGMVGLYCTRRRFRGARRR